MSLALKSAYWSDPQAKGAFKAFALDLFGLDFGEWDSAGYWDDAYTPFSFFEGGEVVSSGCVYLLDAVVNGEPCRLAQISAVGTRPAWRRRGLSRRLIDSGLDWARGRHAGVFLFADDEAIPFYAKCGLRPLDEFLEVLHVAPAPRRPGAVRLGAHRGDLDRIFGYARRRAPVSDRFGILSPRLVVFHALHRLRNTAWEIPALACVVFCRRAGGRLSVFDVVGERVPAFGELYPYLADPLDRIVEFHFGTDKLAVDGARHVALHGNNCFVDAGFPIARPVFPFTARA